MAKVMSATFGAASRSAVDAGRSLHAGGDLRGTEGRAAEVEEAVVDADRLDVQHFGHPEVAGRVPSSLPITRGLGARFAAAP